MKTWLAPLDELNITNIQSKAIVQISPAEIVDLQKNNIY